MEGVKQINLNKQVKVEFIKGAHIIIIVIKDKLITHAIKDYTRQVKTIINMPIIEKYIMEGNIKVIKQVNHKHHYLVVNNAIIEDLNIIVIN
jgi:hypothetical protein